MASLCARSEQCEADIRKKLSARLPNSADVEEIIGFLKREKFLDNARYARAFASDKARFSGWGRNKIRMALAAKRISSDIISEALEYVDPEEYESKAFAAGRAKSRSLNLSQREDAAKLYRHLLARGYESSLAMKVLHELRRESKEEE